MISLLRQYKDAVSCIKQSIIAPVCKMKVLIMYYCMYL